MSVRATDKRSDAAYDGQRAKSVVSFIGSAGIPNRYGGFEAFLEHCAPEIARRVQACIVTCDTHLYEDHSTDFRGVQRCFLTIPANGAWSVLHDLFAFGLVFRRSSHIVVLGVSGGPWFPLFRLLCSVAGKRLVVNIDGVEWRRSKFSRFRRAVLRAFDALAQQSAHVVVYDNLSLRDFVLTTCLHKSVCIGYSGDHVLRVPHVPTEPHSALTVCRIEPENNIDMLIDGALQSPLQRYTIVGNWANSEYGRQLRTAYSHDSRLQMLDPIYDPGQLAILRERCSVYLHGHSVGGTNPSLVEMLFYDCRLLCFDCSFNRSTAGDAAAYFGDASSLTALLSITPRETRKREDLRLKFTRQAIASLYASLLATVK